MKRLPLRSTGGAALVSLLLASAACHAQVPDADTLLRQAIEARATIVSAAAGEKTRAVFLGSAGPCAFAALVRGPSAIENFSVCDGTLTRRSVSPSPWPDTPASREFRQRVIDLALIYGSSSGIDPNGYKISARLAEARSETCKIAEVSTLVDHALVRLDLLPACPH